MSQTTTTRPLARVPGFIRLPGPLVRRLLKFGVPMGPNALVTIRGRISGEPRTQALAVIQAGERRFVIGTFGDTNWCRNMRANPDVELRIGGRVEQAQAKELSTDNATNFFRETLPASVASMDVFGKLASRFLLWYAAPDIKSDPAGAATRRPVFELVSRPSETDRTAT